MATLHSPEYHFVSLRNVSYPAACPIPEYWRLAVNHGQCAKRQVVVCKSIVNRLLPPLCHTGIVAVARQLGAVWTVDMNSGWTLDMPASKRTSISRPVGCTARSSRLGSPSKRRQRAMHRHCAFSRHTFHG